MSPTISKRALKATRTVCIGGGTGVPASIRALGLLGICPDVVVSVADDGGSSGLLRNHTGQVPPGDIRKCLVALAKDPQNPWVRAFRTRLEYANDHALGNLILTTLEKTCGSLEESITLCEQLLETTGHVYPAAFASLLLTGVTRDGLKLSGQSNICKSETALAQVMLEPAEPLANPAAVRAIQDAELIALGPGSLFTSIIPNLLIPEIRDAICASQAATIFICPVADVQGETWGLDAAELTEALLAHGLRDRLDYVLINKQEQAPQPGNVTGYFSAIAQESVKQSAQERESAQLLAETTKTIFRPVQADAETVTAIREQGIKVLVRPLSAWQRPSWHDPGLLAKALASLIADSKHLPTTIYARMTKQGINN